MTEDNISDDYNGARISFIPGAAACDDRLTLQHFRLLTIVGTKNGSRGWCDYWRIGVYGESEADVAIIVDQLMRWGYLHSDGARLRIADGDVELRP